LKSLGNSQALEAALEKFIDDAKTAANVCF
jgi:hypothetical protein